jgi:hypothetical protein
MFISAQLHEALGADECSALTFIAVRQQHDQTAGTAPLRLTGRDELVDDNLGAVGEVAELAFPDEFIRIGRGITVIESQHSFFGQHGVVAVEASLLFLQVLQRMIGTSSQLVRF